MKTIKKQIISLLTLALLGYAGSSFPIFFSPSSSSQQLLIDLKDMKAKHSADCIDLMAKEKELYFKLIKKEGAAWNKFSTKSIKDLGQIDVQNKEQTFSQLLKEALKLHKDENAEWKKEHKTIFEQMATMNAKHEEELRKFEQRVLDHLSAAATARYKTKSVIGSDSNQNLLEQPGMTGYGPDLPSE